MPKTLFATVALELADDQFEAAQHLMVFKPIWDRLAADLTAGNLSATTKIDIAETRAKPATGAKRGRKPRLAAVPPEAA